ncbi:MAG: AI-2E family transporter [Haloarculaceae archaeon]
MVSVNFDVDWARAWWLAFGVVLAGSVLFVVHSFVGTFVFGLFIYYATRRLHGHVERRVGPPSLAAGLSLLGIALPAVLLLLYAVGIGIGELDRFARTTDLQPLLDVVQPYLTLSDLVEGPGSLLTNPAGLKGVETTAQSVLDSLSVVGNGLIHLFVMFALAFYLLRDDDRIAEWVADYGDHYDVLDAYVQAVDASLEKVFYGNILNAAVTGTIGSIAYSLLNVLAPPTIGIPYPALVGLLAGVASLVPIVGMKLVYVPVAAYLAVLAFVGGGGWGFVVLFVGVSFLVVDVVPDLLIRPYVSGGDIHVGALMLAYVLGPLLFGWYGIFLGPILLVLVVHFVRIVLRELIEHRPIEPRPTDPMPIDDGDENGK